MYSDNRNKIVGTGWAFPPTFVKGANVVLSSHDTQNINENLTVLFSTRVGENLSDTVYGTRLRDLVFAPDDSALKHDLKEAVATAIKLYEPRIILENVIIDMIDQKEGIIHLSVTYTIKEVNTRHNFVFPYYTKEGTNLDL